jgi:hypothetical protein
MKDSLQIHDYLVSPQEIGDWEGDEEEVADKLNEIFHYAWDKLPDDLSVEQIQSVMNGIWEALRGETILVDTDLDELIDWADFFINSMLEDSEQRFSDGQ